MNEVFADKQTKTRKQTAKTVSPPSMYAVILHNDDYTTFEFVVGILTGIFGMDVSEAISLTTEIHNKGSAVCGVYPLEIAETKVKMVHESSREAEYPLQCTIRKA